MNSVKVVVVPETELTAMREEMAEIRRNLDEALPRQKVWYTLHECADLKGISFDVLRKLPHWHWPNAGKPRRLVGRSRKYDKCFRWDWVEPWLDRDEEELKAYWQETLKEKAAAGPAA